MSSDAQYDKRADLSPSLKTETLEQIRGSLKKWNRDAAMLRVVHAFLTIMATVCSLLVAAKISAFKPDYIQWLSFMAAVSVGLLSAFDLGSKANRLRRAWRRLRTELLRFENGLSKEEELIKAYALAEEIIGDVKEEPK
jgi:hypothetical protein